LGYRGFRRVGILGVGLFRPVLGYRGFRRVGILGVGLFRPFLRGSVLGLFWGIGVLGG
jgi:hypothetical protein